jgi:carbonic anhydrase
MDKLLAGYRRFRAHGWPEQRRVFESLADFGQRPEALVVGCVDSRVDPARIFNTAPGEILTVRNVANLVPPYAPDAHYHGTSAALEFGVRVLGVSHIVVLGHGMCGGVQALLEGAPEQARDFVGPWMSMAGSVRARAVQLTDVGQRQEFAEREIIRLSLGNLLSFPWIAEPVAAGTLRLHGAWFSIRSGLLMVLRPDGSFGAPE